MRHIRVNSIYPLSKYSYLYLGYIKRNVKTLLLTIQDLTVYIQDRENYYGLVIDTTWVSRYFRR